MLKFTLYALILAALAAAFTKPTAPAVDALLKDRTLAAVTATQVDLADMGLDGALVSLCKLQPNACWDVISGLTTVTYDDRYLYAKIGVDRPGKGNGPQTCYAAFRQLWCL
jgi:hypothetical protein